MKIAALVSIHTRHYWRVKLHAPFPAYASTSFNPHPPLLAGETRLAADQAEQIVSIHTRHYWRVKLAVVKASKLYRSVSIHTRHYWRVKR